MPALDQNPLRRANSKPQIFHMLLAKIKRADLDFPQTYVQVPDERHACAELKFSVSSGIQAAEFSPDAGEKQEGNRYILHCRIAQEGDR